jgi:polyisoprenoid-binding protein YceI
MKPRNLIIAAVAIILVIAAVLIVRDWVIPSFAEPSVTGVPTAQNPFAATKGSALPAASFDDGVQMAAFTDSVRSARAQQPLYRSCTEDRRVTATPTGTALAAGTPEATAEATPAATAEAATGAADPLVVRIIGAESEACYQVGEIFLEQNQFVVAVGVTKTIDGFVQIDRANVANSQIGEIVINIAEFRSDNGRRDGIIRRQWLESNKYPIAKLTDAKLVGLPARAYQDGEALAFEIVGNLQIREVTRPTTFTVTATLTGDTLVVTGYADVLMTDFGFTPPEVGGFVRANNEMRIVLNLVARPE